MVAQTLTREAAIAALDREIARQSFADYCIRVSGDDYEQPPQVVALIDLLQRVEAGEVKRAIVEMPPRSSKSTHISRLFPSWWLGRRPHENVILSSYGQELATGHGRAVRDLLGHPRYPFATKLRGDVKAAGRWQTEQGGGLIAAGVGTGLTGFGGNLVVLDDPIKDRQEAESEIVRNHTWDWYQDVLSTRVMREGAVVVLGTRWHEDDPIGRILASPGASDWVRLRIPYYAEADDPLGRAEGVPLEVFGNVPSVEKGEISAYGFSALYQQRPTPAAGGVFKREWMQRRYCVCESDVCAYFPDAKPLAEDFTRWRLVQTVDIGGKQGVGHDPSAISTWASDGISYPLLDYWSSTAEYADVKPKVVSSWYDWRGFKGAQDHQVLIEDATWAQPLISDLKRETGVLVRAVPAVGSKWIRADAAAPVFESGRVMLPCHASWLPGWLHEHLSFPMAAHDEAVDTTSMAIAELRAIGLVMPTRTIYGRPLRKTAV